jgi:hypothetical protein
MMSEDREPGRDSTGGMGESGIISSYHPPIFAPGFPPGFHLDVPFRPRKLVFELVDEDESRVYWRAVYDDREAPRSPTFAFYAELARGHDREDDRRRFAELVEPRGPLRAWFHLLTGDDVIPRDPTVGDDTSVNVRQPLGSSDVVFRPELLHYDPGPGARVGVATYSGERPVYLARASIFKVEKGHKHIWTSTDAAGVKAVLFVKVGEGQLTRKVKSPQHSEPAHAGAWTSLEASVNVEVTSVSDSCEYENIYILDYKGEFPA